MIWEYFWLASAKDLMWATYLGEHHEKTLDRVSGMCPANNGLRAQGHRDSGRGGGVLLE